MRFTSPHPALHLPPEQEANLPRFLLEAAKTSERAQQPILFPPSHQSVFAARPQAKPLSLRAIADLAYGIAYGLLQGKLGSRPFEKGDVIAVYSPNQVSTPSAGLLNTRYPLAHHPLAPLHTARLCSHRAGHSAGRRHYGVVQPLLQAQRARPSAAHDRRFGGVDGKLRWSAEDGAGG